MGGLRERGTPLWQFESLIWGISSWFPLAGHLALPGSEPIFSLSKAASLVAQRLKRLPCVYVPHLVKMSSSEEWVGQVGITYFTPPPFLTSKEPFREVLLEVKNEENVASISYLEQLHFHFSLSCIGEGNGNPLQCSCLEKPRDGGAWWEAIYGVAQSWTRLKPRSSSISSISYLGRAPLLLLLSSSQIVGLQGMNS